MTDLQPVGLLYSYMLLLNGFIREKKHALPSTDHLLQGN
jgi:hypothetical protein